MSIFGGKSLGTIFNAQTIPTSAQSGGTVYTVASSTAGYGTLGGLGGGYATNAVYGNYTTNITQGYQTAFYIPSPSGQMVSVQFVDATGLQYQLLVDSAYAMLMQQITYQHQASIGMAISITPTSPPHQKMLEGDFSPEEMEKAAQVIEEMGGDLAELH